MEWSSSGASDLFPVECADRSRAGYSRSSRAVRCVDLGGPNEKQSLIQRKLAPRTGSQSRGNCPSFEFSDATAAAMLLILQSASIMANHRRSLWLVWAFLVFD